MRIMPNVVNQRKCKGCSKIFFPPVQDNKWFCPECEKVVEEFKSLKPSPKELDIFLKSKPVFSLKGLGGVLDSVDKVKASWLSEWVLSVEELKEINNKFKK
jgi:hypothetical protein